MSVPITDDTLLTKLLSEGPTAVTNAAGAVVGRFIPSADPLFAEFGVTAEELHREIRDPNTKWFTPEQVMARLREIDQCTG